MERLRINPKALDMAIASQGMTVAEACDKSQVDLIRSMSAGAMSVEDMARLNAGTGIDPVAYVPHFAIKAQERRTEWKN